MNNPASRDPQDPQHHSWKATFGLYTWWLSCDGDNRMFIIVRRIYNDAGDIEMIELLERDQEQIKLVDYLTFYKTFKDGLLQRTSKQP